MLRRLTAPLRARPTFLVIGAQKAGTTPLHRYLVEHPAVLCAEPKEVHFFDNAYDRGSAWYPAHFPARSEVREIRRTLGAAAVGEVTPAYLFHPRAAQRVHAFDPGLRLLAVLRDPVDRAYSQYQMQVRRRGETLSFEEALALEEMELPAELHRARDDPSYISPSGFRRSYVARGLYAAQLERWLELFPRERVLVLSSEELLTEPDAAMATIASFLGVPEWKAPRYPRRSTGSYEPMADETRERLARTFEQHNRRLEELLSRRLDWTRPMREPALPSS